MKKLKTHLKQKVILMHQNVKIKFQPIKTRVCR